MPGRTTGHKKVTRYQIDNKKTKKMGWDKVQHNLLSSNLHFSTLSFRMGKPEKTWYKSEHMSVMVSSLFQLLYLSRF